MRVGTWNLDGRGGEERAAFLRKQDCDVLLLTEVPESWSLPPYRLTPASAQPMLPNGKQWAVVASLQPLLPCPPPHPASAAAVIEGTTYVSSVLPWAGSGGESPWQGKDHPARLTATLEALEPFLRAQKDLVWGGDWNHSLAGLEKAGSKAGREHLLDLLGELQLHVPTACLQHRIPELLSIDHVAVRGGVQGAQRVAAEGDGKVLSDHDLYMVDTSIVVR